MEIEKGWFIGDHLLEWMVGHEVHCRCGWEGHVHGLNDYMCMYRVICSL